jgi:hypothetical protein
VANRSAATSAVNNLARQSALFDGFEPFSGYVPAGFLADFLGSVTDAKFRAMWGIDPTQVGGGQVVTSRPVVSWGEGFFEAVSWFEAARGARLLYDDHLRRLLRRTGSQRLSRPATAEPGAAKLVAVDGDPENFVWVQKHVRDNGIDPDQHWVINYAISDTNKPVLFPVGEPGSGVDNCISTNIAKSRRIYAEEIAARPDLPNVVRNLSISGRTGIQITPVRDRDFRTNVEFVSAVTLADILGPFECVDLLESDIQQSESVVFPPAMDLIKQRVKRMHLATHGAEVHAQLLPLFIECGFEIDCNYEPNTHHDTPWGSFDINDAIIAARNPDL